MAVKNHLQSSSGVQEVVSGTLTISNSLRKCLLSITLQHLDKIFYLMKPDMQVEAGTNI